LPQPPDSTPIGSSFIELQSVDSTNNYARQLISASSLTDRQDASLHGLAIFSHEQVQGKGQRGKVWTAEKDQNIAISIILKPHTSQPTHQFQLNACVAVAAQNLLTRIVGEDCKIKWPNDLYWQDRKAGGILIESTISGSSTGNYSWDWAIAGIGMNINQVVFPSFLNNPVSLKQITGSSFDTVKLAKDFCKLLDEKYTLLLNQGFEPIYQEYVSLLYKLNTVVKFKKEARNFEALVKTVSKDGQLIVQHVIEESLNYGEIEWVFR